MEKAQQAHYRRPRSIDARSGGRRGTALVAGITVIAVVALAACGSGTSTAKSPSSTTPASVAGAPVVKTLGDGVTAQAIKVGISLIDFKCLIGLTDSLRFGQQAVYGAFIKYINDNGGVAGRKIDPVYKTYCPPPLTQQILTVCTSLTEDSNVFAVMGTFYDTSGDAQTCIAKQHKRVLLTFDTTQQIMNMSPPGLIVTPGSNPERLVDVLLELLGRRHTLEGRKVAVLGDQTLVSTVNGTILPGLKKLGVSTGTTGLLNISGSDTTAAQSQLQSFIERWKTEHVDTVFLSSYEVSSPQFVQRLRKALPNVLLLSDNTQVLSYAKQMVHAKVTPNPYEGLITAGGPTHAEYAVGKNWKYCKDVYKKETGQVAPEPDAIIPYKGSKATTLDTYGAINDACQLVTMFRDIGQRVGKYLNNANWVNTVNTFGHIENRGTGQYSSLTAGKYDADDNWRLEAIDSSIPPDGNFKPITPLENITGAG